MQKNIIKISEALGNRYDFLSHNTKKYHYPHQLIKNLCDISGGKRLPAGDYYTDTPTDFKYLQVTDLSADTIDFNNLKNIQEVTFNKLKKYALRKHDIIISIAGTIGKIYYVEDDIKNVILTENCAKIRIKDNIELLPKCFSYIMELPFAQDIINSSYIKTTIPKLGIDKIKAIKFPYPIDTKTQKQIISIMDSAYRQKIEMEKQAQELLDSIDNFVLQELRITLPEKPKEKSFKTKISSILGDRYDPEYNQPYFECLHTSINRVSCTPLINLLLTYKKGIEVGSSAYIEKGVPFVRVSDFNSFGLNFSNNLKYISINEAEQKKEYMPQKGEILYSKDGTLSNSLFLDKNLDAVISGAIIRLIPNEDKINSRYLSIILALDAYKKIAERKAIGTIIKHLNVEKLLAFNIPTPSLDTQGKIADTVQNMIERAKDLRIKAKQNLENAKQKVEKILLGE